MATSNCNQNCGCTSSYTVTAPCPPACAEVFNAQCIVYTGTDIMCNNDTVIKRYDYLDTVITKLVNYLCSVQAPVTEVVGSEYIDVVPNVVANTTTYTVSIDIPALQAYFDTVFQLDILASVLAGPGIVVSPNPITGTVTISHEDTSSVSDLASDNSGNSFIQDIFFTFDTYGHVTGASVVPGTVIPPNDFDRAQINPDSGFVWGPDNDPTNIQIAEAPGDTLNFVAGTGITLNASTVPSTDAIRITNSAPNVDQFIWETITSDSGSTTADSTTDTLTVAGGTGISTAIVGDTLTITNTAPDQTVVLNSGTGISVTGTYPNFTVTNTAPDAPVLLNDAGTATHESLVNDGTGPTLATKGLQAGKGMTLSSTATDISIVADVAKFGTSSYVMPTDVGAPPPTLTINHNLGTFNNQVTVILQSGAYLTQGTDYSLAIIDADNVALTNLNAANTGAALYVSVIG